MSYAVIADVLLVMGIDSAPDGLAEALAAANSWAAEKLPAYDAAGTATKIWYDVREDSLLPLPVPGATVLSIEATSSLSAEVSSDLALDTDYVVIDSRMIRLRHNKIVREFDTAYGQRLPGVYDRVTLSYSWTGTVPAYVKTAVAMIASLIWTRGRGPISGGMTSERIGDYSYVLGVVSGENGGEPDPGWYQIMKLLRPGMRRRVWVT